jgi:hypothetical protein
VRFHSCTQNAAGVLHIWISFYVREPKRKCDVLWSYQIPERWIFYCLQFSAAELKPLSTVTLWSWTKYIPPPVARCGLCQCRLSTAEQTEKLRPISVITFAGQEHRGDGNWRCRSMGSVLHQQWRQSAACGILSCMKLIRAHSTLNFMSPTVTLIAVIKLP